MTVACETLAVKIKANITATNITLTQSECVEPCDTNVTITWENIGGVPGSFEPAVVVNGARTGLGSSINLSPTETHVEVFSLTELIAGTYTICPDPN